MAELGDRLDVDLFDRLSHLSVSVPPLRHCREDLADDWSRVWRELRQREDLPSRHLGRKSSSTRWDATRCPVTFATCSDSRAQRRVTPASSPITPT